MQEQESHTGAERMERLLDEREGRNLWDELIALRDKQREEKDKSVWLIKGKDLPWEDNKQGKMRWYLHPLVKSTCIFNLQLYVQEIPPGSRSGRLLHQGNGVLYILEGNGYTMIDGHKYHWSKNDVVQLPLRTKGIVVQHFNTDSDDRARFVYCEPNSVHALTVDRGSGFEQLEESPEYRPDKKA